MPKSISSKPLWSHPWPRDAYKFKKQDQQKWILHRSSISRPTKRLIGSNYSRLFWDLLLTLNLEIMWNKICFMFLVWLFSFSRQSHADALWHYAIKSFLDPERQFLTKSWNLDMFRPFHACPGGQALAGGVGFYFSEIMSFLFVINLIIFILRL